MSTESKSLFSSAMAKLQSVVGGGRKDSSSLHRWVLLKNSITQSHAQPATPIAAEETVADSDYRHDVEEEHDALGFEFPDPHSVPDDDHSDACNGESQWLDSVLKGLELDEDEDDFPADDATSTSQLRSADEEIEPLSPLYSPMSSSDDLVESSSCCSYHSYPVPYPPAHQPISTAWFALEDSSDSLLPSTHALYDNPLPYSDVDDLDDSSVPDAIEDISDDESDAPSTPSAVSTQSLSPPGSTIPIPRERTRLSHPHVYVERDDFYPLFELDALPFPDDILAPSLRAYRDPYAEC